MIIKFVNISSATWWKVDSVLVDDDKIVISPSMTSSARYTLLRVNPNEQKFVKVENIFVDGEYVGEFYWEEGNS